MTDHATIPREPKLITSHSYVDSDGQGLYELVAVATDGTIWILYPHSSNEWLRLPDLPRADNPHFNPSTLDASRCSRCGVFTDNTTFCKFGHADCIPFGQK